MFMEERSFRLTTIALIAVCSPLAIGQAKKKPVPVKKPAVAPKAPVSTAPPTFKLLKEFQGLRAMQFAPNPINGTVAVSLENTEIRVIDSKTGQTLRVMKGHPQPANALAWSRDGKYLASGDDSARVFVWDGKTGAQLKLIYGEHQRPIEGLSYNKDSTLVTSTGGDDKIIIWSVPGSKRVAQVLGNGAILGKGVFSPVNNDFLATTLTPSARIYSFAGGVIKNRGFLTGHANQGFLAGNWSPDGSRIITGGKDGTAIVWDAKAMKAIATLKGHEDWVWQAVFSPNGRVAATSSPDRSVRLWDMKTFKMLAKFDNQKGVGSPLAFSSDGKTLFTVSINDFLSIYTVTPAQ
jgi:WD40 repeat protein